MDKKVAVRIAFGVLAVALWPVGIFLTKSVHSTVGVFCILLALAFTMAWAMGGS
jgi:hypothetical protein